MKLKAGDSDAFIAIAKEAGFTISAENLQNAQSDISDRELESAVGGANYVNKWETAQCSNCFASKCMSPR